MGTYSKYFQDNIYETDISSVAQRSTNEVLWDKFYIYSEPVINFCISKNFNVSISKIIANLS